MLGHIEQVLLVSRVVDLSKTQFNHSFPLGIKGTFPSDFFEFDITELYSDSCLCDSELVCNLLMSHPAGLPCSVPLVRVFVVRSGLPASLEVIADLLELLQVNLLLAGLRHLHSHLSDGH